MPKPTRDDFDDDRPRRRRRDDPEEEEPPRRRKKRKKKRGGFSLCGAIPLELGVQYVIAGAIGLACFAGALFGKIGALYIPGVIACVWGRAAIAKNNGRSEMFGLLGLFGPIGFAFTAVLAKPTG